MDQNNNVFVADEFNNRIQKFDSNGNFITEFGQDRLGHPIDVAIDSQARVYASDENNDQILIYALANQIPTPPPDSDCTIPGNSNILITGTIGPDTLIGNTGNNLMNGLGENDRMNGCSGSDSVNGNTGNDGIAGGIGNDVVSGGNGDDNVQGGAGNDKVFGNAGVNILTGGPGNDIFFCGPSGQDRITDFQPGQDLRIGTCILGPAVAPTLTSASVPPVSSSTGITNPTPSTLLSLPLPLPLSD